MKKRYSEQLRKEVVSADDVESVKCLMTIVEIAGVEIVVGADDFTKLESFCRNKAKMTIIESLCDEYNVVKSRDTSIKEPGKAVNSVDWECAPLSAHSFAKMKVGNVGVRYWLSDEGYFLYNTGSTNPREYIFGHNNGAFECFDRDDFEVIESTPSALLVNRKCYQFEHRGEVVTGVYQEHFNRFYTLLDWAYVDNCTNIKPLTVSGE